jgi:hypothetical protein
MPTFEEFNAMIKEIRGKLANPNNTPQKNQALWQYIKEYCAQTLQQPGLLPQFEREIKDQLFNAENQLAQYKGKTVGNLPGTQIPPNPVGIVGKPMMQAFSNAGSPRTMNSSGESPADQAPLMDSNVYDVLSSVPAGGFDPNSSPILRRLAQGLPIHESSLKRTSVPPADNAQKPTAMSIPAQIDPNGQPKTEISEEITPVPSVPPAFGANPFPTFPNNPFPQSTDATPNRLAAFLEIIQLSLQIPLPPDKTIHYIGRQDIEQNTKMKLPPGFFDPLLPRVEFVSEHFVIEQPTSGEFWIRDRGNAQKTYFKNKFVDAVGERIDDGDTFILPINYNGQIASLNIVFRIQK